MKHCALWTVGLGLTALACTSATIAPPESTPPAGGNTPVNPAPAQPGGEPSGGRMPPVVAPSPVAPPPVVTPPPSEPPASAPPSGGPGAPTPTGPRGPFTCSLVIGISATGDWFNAGFEKIVDNERWQLMAVHSGFINYWADADHEIWDSKPSSACTKNADNPDRVILTALSLHWEKATVEEWVTQVSGAVKNFKARYSNLANLELATFVRSPGDKPCPLGDTFRAYDLDAADQAFEKVAAMFPELVTVAPKVHVDSCDDYANHPPTCPVAPPRAPRSRWARSTWNQPTRNQVSSVSQSLRSLLDERMNARRRGSISISRGR